MNEWMDSERRKNGMGKINFGKTKRRERTVGKSVRKRQWEREQEGQNRETIFRITLGQKPIIATTLFYHCAKETNQKPIHFQTHLLAFRFQQNMNASFRQSRIEIVMPLEYLKRNSTEICSV